MPQPHADPLQVLEASRYVVPLKEGGSLPAVVDTNDQDGDHAGLFVVKFRGAGQGVKALVAELIVGRLAQRLGFRVPELAVVELAEEFGMAERDPEIQDILRGSRGPNVGLRYLDGAFNFDAATVDEIEPLFASRLVWLDALTFQIDRTARNPNLLSWQEPADSGHSSEPWLIDHGAALYPHHDWPSMTLERAADPFAFIKDHVLLRQASLIQQADLELAPLALAAVENVVEEIPDRLLETVAEENGDPDALRAHYRAFLEARLAGPRTFSKNAQDAHHRSLS